MASAQIAFRSRRNRSRGISLPDMSPFVSLVILFVCFYMLTGRFEDPTEGLVSAEQVPTSIPSCSRVSYKAVVSIDKQNQMSFAVGEEDFPATKKAELQVRVIKQVAALHHINFTPEQTAILKSLPFLSIDIERLPAYLNLPPLQRAMLGQSKRFGTLTTAQLAECVTTARRVVVEVTKKPAYVQLNINTQTHPPQIMRVIDLLQDQGINRFNLLTQCECQ